jgi:hypothetical protein
MLRPAGRELNGDPDDEQVIDVMMVTTGWIEEANACKTLQQRRACVRTGRAGRGSGAAPARSWIFSIVRQRARRTRTCQDRRRIQIHQTTRSPVTTTVPGVRVCRSMRGGSLVTGRISPSSTRRGKDMNY